MKFTDAEIQEFITWLGYFDSEYIVSISHLPIEKFANRLSQVAKVFTEASVSSKFIEMLGIIPPNLVAVIASKSTSEEKTDLLKRIVLSNHFGKTTTFIAPASPKKYMSPVKFETGGQNKESDLTLEDFLVELASKDPLVRDILDSPQKKRGSPIKGRVSPPSPSKINRDLVLPSKPQHTVVPCTVFDNIRLPPFPAFASILNNPVANLQLTTNTESVPVPNFAPFMTPLANDTNLLKFFKRPVKRGSQQKPAQSKRPRK